MPLRFTACRVNAAITIAIETAANCGPKALDRQSKVEVQQMLSADLFLPQAPQLFGVVVPGKHPQIIVYDDHPALQAVSTDSRKALAD